MTLPITEQDTFEILDTEFELDQLKDICAHGMAQGVAGFIYSYELINTFDLFEDEIMTYLNAQIDDIYGTSAIKYLASNDKFEHDSLNDMKQDLVWLYVELKAQYIVSTVDPDF